MNTAEKNLVFAGIRIAGILLMLLGIFYLGSGPNGTVPVIFISTGILMIIVGVRYPLPEE